MVKQIMPFGLVGDEEGKRGREKLPEAARMNGQAYDTNGLLNRCMGAL